MKKLFIYIISIFALCSCVKEEQFDNTARGNFEACWKIINERYCFFEYKDIDWQDIYYKYEQKIESPMRADSLFSVLNQMLCELKDGHVNIYSSFDVGRYWDWFENYPNNFDSSIQKNYIGTNYKIAGGMKYTILPDSVGYIYYGSFESGPSDTNLDNIFRYFSECKGLIIDIRDNGGGTLSFVERIVGRFITERICAGYIQHKTGKGHNDFSSLHPFYFDPSNRIKWFKPIAVLTNRHTYSAANNFASVMQSIPHAKLFGDRTGGGCGLPFSSELPVGWSIRFSASPIYDINKNLTEFGIDPDFNVQMSESGMMGGKDDIIDAAIGYILQQ